MTADILRAVGAGVAALFFLAVLRQYSPALSAAASFAVSAVVLWIALKAGSPLFELIGELSRSTDATGFSCLLKAAAVALIAQFAQDACRESGQTALAGQIDFAGKVGVLLSAAPLLQETAELLLRLLK